MKPLHQGKGDHGNMGSGISKKVLTRDFVFDRD